MSQAQGQEQQNAQPSLCITGCGFFSVSSLDSPRHPMRSRRVAASAASVLVLGVLSTFEDLREREPLSSAQFSTSPRTVAPTGALDVPPLFHPLQNIGTNGMCSKCHRDAQKAEQESQAAQKNITQALVRNASPSSHAGTPPQAAPSLPSPQPPPQPMPADAKAAAGQAGALQEQQQTGPSTSGPPSSSSSPAPLPSACAAAPPRKPPSTTRCLVCAKKVGLTGFNCRCNPEAVFCSTHRLAEAHDCTFDYKSSQRQLLAERNPVVAGAKVEKL